MTDWGKLEPGWNVRILGGDIRGHRCLYCKPRGRQKGRGPFNDVLEPNEREPELNPSTAPYRHHERS